MLPPALLYFWLVLLPVIQAVYFSLYKWNGLGPMQDFIGLDNYVRILSDRVFLQALGHNLLIVVLSTAVQLPLALALALLIRQNLRGRTVFRMIFFLPYVLSEVVTGVIWSFIYNPQTGLINSVLSAIIPGYKPQGWLGDPSLVIFALFVVDLLEVLRAPPDPVHGRAAKHPGGAGGGRADRRGHAACACCAT